MFSRFFCCVVALTLAVCAPSATWAGGAERRPRTGPEPGFYFGRIAFEDDVVGISVSPEGRVRALVTDAQPGGDAEWFEGRTREPSIRLRSESGRSRLEATFDADLNYCAGEIRMPNGQTRAMAADLAGEGADLYDISVRRGHYFGRSIQGNRLNALQVGAFVVGTLTERSGTVIPFEVMDLSQAFGYSIQGGQNGQYTAIISRNGTLHYGRAGAVKKGRPGRDLIALDIPTTDDPTPGFYFGKVAFERDVIGVQISGPPGALTIRAYASDSEPEPEGDVQWFSGPLGGDQTANLVSASGDASLQASVTKALVAGTLTLPGGRARRFFALPAGEGAGIYDVVVGEDGTITGSSEAGATLEATQDGVFVHLVIRTPDGRVFESHPNDLTRALDYPIAGNQPDTYVAIVAPRGRFVFGRSGFVRFGSPGLNIIGLDKAC